ncbi:SBBP repeat-containing protein [Hymenobacter seoulensis]
MSYWYAISHLFPSSITRCLLLIGCCTGLIYSVQAQQVTEAWAVRYAGSSPTTSSVERAVAVALDKAGNSYVTGMSTPAGSQGAGMVTIKYSPAGQRVWVVESALVTPTSLALDNTGGVFITGHGPTGFTTLRLDAATGQQSWLSTHSSTGEANWPVRIAVDNQGGVYVLGTGQSVTGYSPNYETIRYNAATGAQTWVSLFSGGEGATVASAIAVDNAGGVYVTGTNSYFRGGSAVTVRYAATTGAQSWVSRYNDSYDTSGSAIAVDNAGGVYVTGTSAVRFSGSTYATVRYDAATGTQSWASSSFDVTTSQADARALAVDQTGLYVTGTHRVLSSGLISLGTVRLDAATGNQKWVTLFPGSGTGNAVAAAIAADGQGGVYVTGTSDQGSTREYVTLRYQAKDGSTVWTQRKAGTSNEAAGLAVDAQQNVWVTGTSQDPVSGLDLLTVKYTQPSCLPVTERPITGASTVPAGTTQALFALAGSGAATFQWSITGPQPVAFTGQGTAQITAGWPATGVYKIRVVYGGGAGCPPQASVKYVAVYNLNAGFITGSGAFQSPAVAGYELMKQGGAAEFETVAKYLPRATTVTGTTRLHVKGAFRFTSTATTSARLVVGGNQASYAGVGTVAVYRGLQVVADPRQFNFLVSATDGQHQRAASGPDQLRLQVWVRNPDGSPGLVVYDSQVGCTGASLDENAAACRPISQGNLVIHTPGGKGNGNGGKEAASLGSSAGSLSAFPTVVSELASVSFVAEQQGAYELACYDAQGTLVRTLGRGQAEIGSAQQAVFNAAGLREGVYIIRLQTSTYSHIVRVSVQR